MGSFALDIAVSPLVGKSGAIFSELEKRFSTGYYAFGDPISVVELAAEFGVSQQPLRAALGQLRALGFVIITPQVGCRVASPGEVEIRDFFNLFGRMEGVMAALAAERYDVAQLSHLEQVSERIVACPIPTRGIPAEYAKLVREWHAALRLLADSSALAWRVGSFASMADFLLWQGAPNLTSEAISIANQQRQAIRDAIAARNGELAERLMFEHVRGKPQRVGILRNKP
ncbi:GntR family transcriptional regulator [Pseudomonas citronellolis]|uniref:GntR family transcriptional regulator n=1 Tax=Pseudomonas citronellolis TaxID=53408 RepID=UPI000853EEC6|nr:GntR family transcriptional regulator [Pseudomonas humi]